MDMCRGKTLEIGLRFSTDAHHVPLVEGRILQANDRAAPKVGNRLKGYSDTLGKTKANCRTRTDDRLITNQLLYQLS